MSKILAKTNELFSSTKMSEKATEGGERRWRMPFAKEMMNDDLGCWVLSVERWDGF